MASDLPDFERVVAWLAQVEKDAIDETQRRAAIQHDDVGEFVDVGIKAADALRLLRAMREDFARACKIIEAKDKLLVAYRIGRAPGNALDYLAANQEKLAAARERLGLR